MRTSFVFAAILLMAISFSSSTTIGTPKTLTKANAVAAKSSATVRFITHVDKLRIRERPDLNAPVVAELPEKEYVRYLHETGGAPTEVTLRGIKQQGTWYKVAWPSYEDSGRKKVEGWVFSGGVSLASIEFSGDIATELNFDFLSGKKITKAQFDTQAALYKDHFHDDTKKYSSNKGPIKLPLGNGGVKVVGNAPCRIQPSKELEPESYQGQFPEFGWYLIGRECYHAEIAQDWGYLVRKSDGKIEVEISESFPPTIAPNGQNIGINFSEDCGSVLGIDFFRLRQKQWSSFSIIFEYPINIEKLIWSPDSKYCLAKCTLYADYQNNKIIGTHYYSISFP